MSGHTPWREVKHKGPPAGDRLFLLTFSARRRWWLPWPRQTVTISKVTTWADVYEIAETISEDAGAEVDVKWWHLEHAPPKLLRAAAAS